MARSAGGDGVEVRIAAAVARGDLDGAATVLLRSIGPEILGYVRTLCQTADDSAEVFSQFAEDLWRAMPNARSAVSVRAYAYRIAYHAAARFYADGYRRRRRPMPSSASSRVAQSIHRRSRAALERGLDALASIRAGLSPSDQTLLTLRLDRDLSWREIADVLSTGDRRLEPAALRKRFERLKGRIAALARQQGLISV